MFLRKGAFLFKRIQLHVRNVLWNRENTNWWIYSTTDNKEKYCTCQIIKKKYWNISSTLKARLNVFKYASPYIHGHGKATQWLKLYLNVYSLFLSWQFHLSSLSCLDSFALRVSVLHERLDRMPRCATSIMVSGALQWKQQLQACPLTSKRMYCAWMLRSS